MKITAALKKLLPLHEFSRSARLFLMATIVDGVIYSAWSLFFNFYILSRGFDKGFLGLANSLASIASLLFGIPLGMLSDRIGRRRAMLIGLVINTIAMGLQVSVRQPSLLLVMVFIGGIGSSLYFISQAPFMMSASDDKTRSLLFSLNFGLVTLSGAVGSLFAGQLPGLFGNLLKVLPDSAEAYQAVLLCAVVLGSLSLLPISLIHEKPVERGQKGAALKQTLDVLSKPTLWKLLLPNTLLGIGAGILIPYMNVFFVERFHLEDSVLGVLFSLSSLLTGIGCVLGPRIAERWKSKIRTVVFTQGLSLVFLVMLGFTPFGWLAAIAFLARGTFMNMASPLYTAFAMERYPESEQGTANSMLSITWTLGWAIGPYVSGLTQQRYGFTPLFVATTILYALSISSAWVFFHKAEKRQPEPATAISGTGLEDVNLPVLND